MDEINHIKYLRDRKGQSLREIARETGYAFGTVKKYAEKQDFNIVKHKQRRRSKLDPYKAIIDEWLTNDLKEKPKQRHTAKRVYDRLQEMYGLEFKVLKEFNQNLLEKAVQDMQRKHYKKGKLIADLFAEDLATMHNLPETPFEIGRYEKVKADKYAKVRFDSKQFNIAHLCWQTIMGKGHRPGNYHYG